MENRLGDAIRDHPTLGLVAPAAARAEATAVEQRTAWEYGAYSAAHTLERVRAALQATSAAGGLAAVGLALPQFWPVRLVLGAAAGLAIYFLIPLVWALIVATVAPVKQRDAARQALRTSRQRVGLAAELWAAVEVLGQTSLIMQTWDAAVPRSPEEREQEFQTKGDWFLDFANKLADTMERDGLPRERAVSFRVSRDVNGHLQAVATMQQRAETFGQLVNMIPQYRDPLIALARQLGR